MKRLISVLILVILLFASCRKNEGESKWEKSFGKGEALFINNSPDSGLVACGEAEGYPYFLRLSRSKKTILDFSADDVGLFSSVWFDTSGYVFGGNTLGKMLLMRYSPGGNMLWEKTFDTGSKIDYTILSYEENGNILAVGTSSPDSAEVETADLFFVRFDTIGQIIEEKQIKGAPFIAANGVALDKDDNIYLALTRNVTGSRPKASVAKFNNAFQKLWETELYTNPSYGSATLAIKLDESGNVYAAGKTELSAKNGVLSNSFLASLTNSGSVRWKKYFENSNEGRALIFNGTGKLLMLNRNCCIVNMSDTESGSDHGSLRMFEVCVSDDTDAFGADFVMNYDNDILVAGSYGGNFYLSMKSLQ